MEKFDVIVIGVGSMGSSTCYHLAKQGERVLGIEQFDIPNELSSHTGHTRIIRKAYYEHPDYVPLLERSYQNWKQLEDITGTQVYFQTGLLYAGQRDHELLKGVHASADKHHIKLENISADDIKKKYPAFHPPPDYEILFEPEAGFLRPEIAIGLYHKLALGLGADIRTNEKTHGWRKRGAGIEVNSNKGSYFAKKLIITAGPWAGKMIPGYSSTLSITRQLMAWVLPENPNLFELGKLPCWIIADGNTRGVFYGFPILPDGGLQGFKLAHHYPGAITDPDTLKRLPSAGEENNLVDILQRFFPGSYKKTEALKTCMYTNTADQHFILDFLPGFDKNVVIATGFSGHGFKFASVVGEIMSELAIKGTTSLPIGFLNAGRFARKK